MSELRTRVEELKMENEYQLRLKDMNYNEKIKDLTDKFIQEIEALKAKNEVKRILLIHLLVYHIVCIHMSPSILPFIYPSVHLSTSCIHIEFKNREGKTRS